MKHPLQDENDPGRVTVRLPLGGLARPLPETPDDRLERLASRATSVLRIAIRGHFCGRIALVSSFGAESAGLLHLVASIDRTTPVIFLDTGHHFAETLEYKRRLCALLELANVIVASPDDRLLAEEDPERTLFASHADRCCQLRKVEPLSRALIGFDAWITGRKSYQGPGRFDLPIYEKVGQRVKINPLVDWTARDTVEYLRASRLPPHPLVDRGFPSIGCSPCTSAVEFGEPSRSGRWRGLSKTECGIHTYSRQRRELSF